MMKDQVLYLTKMGVPTVAIVGEEVTRSFSNFVMETTWLPRLLTFHSKLEKHF